MPFNFKIYLLYKLHKRIYKSYDSIDFLPIWNYKQIEKSIENNKPDLRYLIKNIDYEHLPKIYLNLREIWNNIYNSFIDIANPEGIENIKNDFIMYATDNNKYLFLKTAINSLSNKDFLKEETKNNLIRIIRQLGYRFDESTENSYYNSIIDLKRQIVGLKKMIELRVFKLENKYKNKSNPMDIEDILTLFTEVFPGTIFNSKSLTCKQYLSYLKRYNKIASEQKQKQQNGR